MKLTLRLSLLLALLSVSVSTSAQAGHATQTVEKMHDAAVKDDLAALDRHVDYLTIAKASLAQNWSTFTEAEQKQFVGNFQKIVRSTYKKGLGGKDKKPLNIVGETSTDKGFLVQTKVPLDKAEPDLKIDYLLNCPTAKCQLVDVVTDGSSLVSSWKRMFRRIFKKHGKAGILSRIEKKAKALPGK